jgi:hypothetical protein
MITRARALDIIARHGWHPEALTAVDMRGDWVEGSSFDDEMGVHNWYRYRDVMAWLGY